MSLTSASPPSTNSALAAWDKKALPSPTRTGTTFEASTSATPGAVAATAKLPMAPPAPAGSSCCGKSSAQAPSAMGGNHSTCKRPCATDFTMPLDQRPSLGRAAQTSPPRLTPTFPSSHLASNVRRAARTTAPLCNRPACFHSANAASRSERNHWTVRSADCLGASSTPVAAFRRSCSSMASASETRMPDSVSSGKFDALAKSRNKTSAAPPPA
mmetsp:Transcript_13259/g.35515  ORF Transcript_13259/g.35515 Transcript_13259/m.35515 type:complete len:214 (-) Transcript_13259:417-1058(-)